MTKIYVVRHAEADGNIYRRVHGHYDGYITPNGYRQIEALRARFADISVDSVFTSDLFRTHTTAGAIYKGRGIPCTPLKTLREINLGVWEDKCWGELPFFFPEQYDAWTHHPHDFKVDGSETHEQVFHRIKAQLDKLVSDNPDRTIAVVSHGAAIRALLCGLTYGDFTRLGEIGWCDNTAVALIEADSELNYNIVFQNDNSHLAELSTLKHQKWWREGDNQALYNLWFKSADNSKDMELAVSYHQKAWHEIFANDKQSRSQSSSYLKSLTKTCDGAIAFAHQGDHIIGAIALDGDARITPDGGHIAMLYLDDEYRGKNFGVQFLGYAISVYRALGRKFLTVRVAEHNDHAIAFYKKYGFEEISRENSGVFRQILMKKPIYFTISD